MDPADKALLINNDICPMCHTSNNNDHKCIPSNIICTRFYTLNELSKPCKIKEEYVYIRKTIKRPQTR